MAGFAIFYLRVLNVGMNGDGEIGGKGPRCCGPDEEVGVALIRQRKFDVDAGVLDVFVFELGVGQGGLILNGPGDGFQFFVDQSGLDKFREDFECAGLVIRRHRRIWFVPFAENAEALELFRLELHVFVRIFKAQFANFHDRHLAQFRPNLLLDFVLDGQAMAVPARDVG